MSQPGPAAATWGTVGVTVRRGGHTVLRDVSMEVSPGTMAAVVGGDGAGKTSLLRALVGSLPVAEGIVRRPERDQLGYVSAAPGGYGDMTVMENLVFSARVYRVPAGARAGRISELLEQMQLEDAANRLAEHLSGGMRHKLAVAMAIVHNPRLLVLDEPTTGIDPVGRAELWQIMGRLSAAGTAIVFSTTYLDEAERSTTVTVLADGSVLLAGTPDHLIAGIPGSIRTMDQPPTEGVAWRHGPEWRVWLDKGSAAPAGTRAATATLEDAAIVAELRLQGGLPEAA
jgi:ABC-type multidrug transport system ATPase subunit